MKRLTPSHTRSALQAHGVHEAHSPCQKCYRRLLAFGLSSNCSTSRPPLPPPPPPPQPIARDSARQCVLCAPLRRTRPILLISLSTCSRYSAMPSGGPAAPARTVAQVMAGRVLWTHIAAPVSGSPRQSQGSRRGRGRALCTLFAVAALSGRSIPLTFAHLLENKTDRVVFRPELHTELKAV